MMEMFADSAITIPDVLKVDRAHAIRELGPRNKRGATAKGQDAMRKEHEVSCKAFKTLLVDRLAKASVLTAVLWRWVLPSGVAFTGPTPLKFSDFEFYSDYIQPEYEATGFLQARKPSPERLF